MPAHVVRGGSRSRRPGRGRSASAPAGRPVSPRYLLADSGYLYIARIPNKALKVNGDETRKSNRERVYPSAREHGKARHRRREARRPVPRRGTMRGTALSRISLVDSRECGVTGLCTPAPPRAFASEFAAHTSTRPWSRPAIRALTHCELADMWGVAQSAARPRRPWWAAPCCSQRGWRRRAAADARGVRGKRSSGFGRRDCV